MLSVRRENFLMMEVLLALLIVSGIGSLTLYGCANLLRQQHFLLQRSQLEPWVESSFQQLHTELAREMPKRKELEKGKLLQLFPDARVDLFGRSKTFRRFCFIVLDETLQGEHQLLKVSLRFEGEEREYATAFTLQRS